MNKELESAISTATDLPTIPVVAMKVMQLVEDETSTADQMSKIVMSDPAVAARVLKISNSSYYGCRRQIQTLSGAIVTLGWGTLRSIILATSLKQAFKPFGLTEKMLWEHSLGAALAARTIATHTHSANEEVAFLAGLLHDIGKLIMNSLDPLKFQAVMQATYNGNETFGEAERAIYPFCHEEVGAHVIKKWNFPDSLTTTTLQHHSLNFTAADDQEVINLTAVTALADVFCWKAGVGIRAPHDIDLASTKAAKMLNVTDVRAEAMYSIFLIAYEEDRGTFNI